MLETYTIPLYIVGNRNVSNKRRGWSSNNCPSCADHVCIALSVKIFACQLGRVLRVPIIYELRQSIVSLVIGWINDVRILRVDFMPIATSIEPEHFKLANAISRRGCF